jgi:hypothetical protein
MAFDSRVLIRGNSVKSRQRTVLVMPLAVVAVLAFGAGIALRGWGDEGGAAPPVAVKAIDADQPSRSIRLIEADPGTLKRIPERRPPAAGASVAADPSVSAAPQPPAAPPAPATAAPAPDTTTDDSFDLPDQPPTITFDSDG